MQGDIRWQHDRSLSLLLAPFCNSLVMILKQELTNLTSIEGKTEQWLPRFGCSLLLLPEGKRGLYLSSLYYLWATGRKSMLINNFDKNCNACRNFVKLPYRQSELDTNGKKMDNRNRRSHAFCIYFAVTSKWNRKCNLRPVSNVDRATAVPNSVDRVKFDFSTAIARRLKPSCATAV